MADPNVMVEDENGVLRRAQLVSNQEGTIYYQDNPNSTNAQVVGSDGQLHRVQLVAVVGGIADKHNLGYYTDEEALKEAHPEAEPGDWALVGSTDTIWVWDDESESWIDTATKGLVQSVNGKVGIVSLDAKDVSATPQLLALPEATSEVVGLVVQYSGPTNGTYTNGYFYKCVSDEQSEPTYSWSQVDVQPSPDPLPSQTGQSGKFLTTDGTDASWGTIPIEVNTSKGSIKIGSSYNLPNNYANIMIGTNTHIANNSAGNICIGRYASARDGSICIGNMDAYGQNSIAINGSTGLYAQFAIQLGGGTNSLAKNNDANTFKVANGNGNFEIMSADGTIPTDRFTTTPVAAGTYMAKIVVDGQGAVTRSWGSAPDPLPSQTGNAGKVLGTDGTNAAWETKTTITFRTWGANE